MKLYYKGKYNGDPASIPGRGHEPGAVRFKEFKTMKGLAIFANILACVIVILLIAVYEWRTGGYNGVNVLWGCLLAMAALFPHEFLHAICFKEDVYLYTNLKQGLLFVTGPERMSKGRFIFLSMLPNLVFGFIPFALFLIWPNLTLLGAMGMVGIGSGAGDYYNVFNALTQVPKGAKVYMHQISSYWYLPEAL